MTTSAFVGANPTGELITSGLPVIRDQSGVSSCSLPRTTLHPFRKANVGQGNNEYKTTE
jgi:hypothetical protein